MTKGELRAQPKKCTFLPRRAEEEAQIAATPLLSEGHFRIQPSNNTGSEGGLCPPRAGLAQHLPLAPLTLPQSRSGEPWTVLYILINITDPGTAQTLIPAWTCQRVLSSNTAEPRPALNIK